MGFCRLSKMPLNYEPSQTDEFRNTRRSGYSSYYGLENSCSDLPRRLAPVLVRGLCGHDPPAGPKARTTTVVVSSPSSCVEPRSHSIADARTKDLGRTKDQAPSTKHDDGKPEGPHYDSVRRSSRLHCHLLRVLRDRPRSVLLAQTER